MKKGRPKTRRKKQRTDYIKAFQQSLKSKKARSEEAEEESARGPAPGPAPRPARKRKAAAAAAAPPTRKPSARSRKTTPAAAPPTNDGISAFIVSDPESFQLPPSGPERDKYSAVSKFILKHLLHARARSAGSLKLDSCSLHVVATDQDPAFTAPSTTFEHGILTKARKRSHMSKSNMMMVPLRLSHTCPSSSPKTLKTIQS
mmetsp:Transcript_14466/g.19335  ORF Transcript_14466/g.19335 Transcript_14466/m.19335 type:complete len:202 (+) Transcript_14466:236-841(+)